jgi:hypothetical protein
MKGINKRLYEEQIVKKIIAIAVSNAIDANVKKDEIHLFIKNEFDKIIQKVIKG